MSEQPSPSAELARIMESANRLGVEMNEGEALQWLAAIAASQTGGDVVVDTQSGVYGHRVTMLDFSPAELSRFRHIGAIVDIVDRPGVVETALALSGSAAQSKIQTFPGDCDFFERVNIKATTREEALRILCEVMKDKVLTTVKGPEYQFLSCKYGSYPFDAVKDGKPRKARLPIEWRLEEVRAGQFDAFKPDGTPVTIAWDEQANDPGWCKLDWVIVDKTRNQLANASLVLDVTWEAPDGSITPLDGYLDPYFQEVYLEADSLPIFSKVVRHVSPDSLDEYVETLEHEVTKYLGASHLNYAKAAKRMYNIFRLTGRYPEAAYVRELFDEPATVLYQVWSLIQTLDDAVQPGSGIPMESLRGQTDQLILTVVKALEGDEETQIIKELLELRDALTHHESGQGWTTELETCRTHVIRVVNDFFYDRLTALPTIQEYITAHQSQQS